MYKSIIIFAICILNVCSGCSKAVNGESEEIIKSFKNEVNNNLFVGLEDIDTINASCCMSNTCTKNKKEITKVVSLLQSISLEYADEQEGAEERLSADGQVNFQLNEAGEEIVDVILSSKAMRINGEWYLTEDEDILLEIENHLYSFENV